MIKTFLDNWKTARILTVACGLLFCAFSFIYLYVFQVDVMETLHYVSMGGEVYSPFWGAVLITGVLLLLRWGVNALLGLKGYVRTLSYFPSFLLLGVITDVDYTLYEEGIASYWAWLLPVCLLFFILTVFVWRRICRRWMDAEIDNGAMVFSNLTLFLLLCFVTVGIGNTDIHFHHELEIAGAIRCRNYEEARKVGAKVVDPNRALTALRAYALSEEGTMGEYLFQYPQRFGAEGLLIAECATPYLPSSVQSLYTHWGEVPRKGEEALSFFHRLADENPHHSFAKEYYLAALLLEKDLDAFVATLCRVYPCDDNLPRYYKEALFLYGKLHPESGISVGGESMEQQWASYREWQEEYAQGKGEANLMRRKYGDTYWWYYQY